MSVKIYHNPRCSKSRQALQLLEQKEVELEVIPYLDKGLEVNEVLNLSKLLGLDVKDFVRTKEDEYKQINIDWSNNDQAAQKLSEFPKILERPIVINGNQAVVARPPEKLEELF